MINVSKIRGKMAEKGLSGLDMAKAIKKTPKTFYSKMKSGVFDSDEIEVIIKELDIEDPLDIFFAEEVT